MTGTRFTVDLHGDRMAIAVAAGEVLVGAGELPADVGAWQEGWLVFDRTPLPEVLARWNDYLPQPLLLGHSPALATLRLTGSFAANDLRSFLLSLPQVLPVTVETDAAGQTRIDAHRWCLSVAGA